MPDRDLYQHVLDAHDSRAASVPEGCPHVIDLEGTPACTRASAQLLAHAHLIDTVRHAVAVLQPLVTGQRHGVPGGLVAVHTRRVDLAAAVDAVQALSDATTKAT